MAIIRNTMEDIKRYIGSNGQTDATRKEEALRALSLFMCPQVMENSALHAVVGFEDNNVPQFWDMTEGNLLATCKTGVAMNYMGCTTVLVSMLLRFTKEEFQYYLFTDEFAPNYLRENESCAGNVAVLFEEREVYRRSLEKLFDELNYRKTLSEAELKKQPFLLVVFGNACRFFDDNEEINHELFSLLFRQRKRLRVACMVMTMRFEREFLYHQYKDTFSCFVVGSTYPETAKELLQNDIPDWLIDGRRTDKLLFQNNGNRVQIQTYHLPLGIGCGKCRMDEISRTCCFTGPRPKNYPWENDKECKAKIAEKLNIAVQEAIKRGYRHFISGMAAGIDLLAAKIVLQLRGDMPEMKITLEAAIPFPSQSKRWKEETKREYESILLRCDKVHCVYDVFSLEAYKKRDKYMVDNSSLLIAVEGKPNGGTARTIMYANELDRTIELIGL